MYNKDMPKNRFQGGSKAKMVTIEWTTKNGEVFVKQQKLPIGRKKKIDR